MHEVKRIEIVIEKSHMRQLRRALDGVGVPGLTVFEAAAGYGDRGERSGGELSDAQVNCCILTTCRVEQLDAVASVIEPLLRRYGGLCLISDAMVIRSEQ